jgi:hypothetical protein
VLQVRELRVPGTRDSDAYDATSMVASDHGWGRYNAMKNSHH